MIRTRMRIPVSPRTLATRSEFPSTRKQITAVMAMAARIAGYERPVSLRLADQHHNARNRAGAGKHGDAERHDAGVFLHRGRFGFRACLLRGRAFGIQHIQTDQQQDDPAGDLECRQRNAEHPEDVLACERKGRKHDEGRDARLPRHDAAPLFVRTRGHGEERRQGGDGIHQEKDGAKSEQRKSYVRRVFDLEESVRRLDKQNCGRKGKSMQHNLFSHAERAK